MQEEIKMNLLLIGIGLSALFMLIYYLVLLMRGDCQ